MKRVKWLDVPEEHDYPAAREYLDLTFTSDYSYSYTLRLIAAPIRDFKAKDILRASRLSPLGMKNKHVEKNTKKIEDGEPLSPILLVRSDDGVIVADGYHRLCAVYHYDEDSIIKCKLV